MLASLYLKHVLLEVPKNEQTEDLLGFRDWRYEL